MKMILLISILLYFLLNLIIIKKKIKDFSNYNYLFLKIKFSKVLLNLVILSLFLIVYLGFFKFLRIFKESKYIDLNLFFHFFSKININMLTLIAIVVALLFFFFLIRLLRFLTIFFLKKVFLESNYYYQHCSDFYCQCYSNIIIWQYSFWYWITSGKKKYVYKKQILSFIYYFFKLVGYVVIGICLIIDIKYNSLILINFSGFLPFFSLYQTIYHINNFFSRKINLNNEFYIFTSLYINEIHKKKLIDEYNNSEKRISFDTYVNISKNFLGDVVPTLDHDSYVYNNNYILSLFD